MKMECCTCYLIFLKYNNMKPTRVILLLVLVFIISLSGRAQVNAQDKLPAEVEVIVKMKLEEGQEKLSSLGYEICSSSFMGKKQDWFNESIQTCVTIRFDRKTKEITEVLLNPETAVCQKGLEASRKLWENYHDGQAPVNSQKIEEERKKLTDQGYIVSYWVNEVSPGRCAEYWVNETTQKVMVIVWEIKGNVWVMTNSSTNSMGDNPAPKRTN